MSFEFSNVLWVLVNTLLKMALNLVSNAPYIINHHEFSDMIFPRKAMRYNGPEGSLAKTGSQSIAKQLIVPKVF